MRNNSNLGVMLLAAMAAAGGCSTAQDRMPLAAYYLQNPHVMDSMARVTMISLQSSSEMNAQALQMTTSLAQAISARQLFQIDVVPIDAPVLAPLTLDPHRTMTLEQMNKARQLLGCDAILLGLVTEFQPYPRMRMGLRLQLIDLRTGSLAWGVSHCWSALDAVTAKRIQQWYQLRTAGTCEPLQWRVAMVSPQTFGEFVAHDVASTFPVRSPAGAMTSGRTSDKTLKSARPPAIIQADRMPTGVGDAY